MRSSRWLHGTDEVALLHRVAMRSAGHPVSAGESRPVIGIADSASDLNPCNLSLRRLVAEVAAGVTEAGGIPVGFPVMSLGEDLMKPSAMLYRNLLSIEVEEYLRAYPLDGVVLLANCDKSVPGAVMGALSADLPTVVVTGGPRPAGRYQGQRVGSGSAVWRMLQERTAGRVADDEWTAFEGCLASGPGACNTMGTASTMALLVEALGLSLPGSSGPEAGSPERAAVAREAGAAAVRAVLEGRTPSRFLGPASFRNAVRVLQAIGGSTNAVIHLIAIAGRAGVPLALQDVDALGRGVPLLVDVEPSGAGLVQDLAADGGLPALLHRLAGLPGLVDLDALTVTGRPWSEHVVPPPDAATVLRPVDDPLTADGCIAVVRGSLAPRGAVVKTSAASPSLLRHRGHALVFRDYHDMRARLDDPALDVAPDTVLVLAGAGAVGAPGMPEWGMVPVPRRLARAGVRDMVRVSDARMSGTSFGTCVLHVAPEAAVGGPLGVVRDGDPIVLDVPARRLDLDVDERELGRRLTGRTTRAPTPDRGWPALYAAHVTQPDEGCDLDFLRIRPGARPTLHEPVIGRS